MAAMPWPRPLRPPSRQSKPSTRTAGWNTRAHPAAERGDAIGVGAGRGVGRTATGAGVAGDITGHHGMGLPGQSMPNRLSWTTGFEARRGGEPQNSGGCGDAADRLLSSPFDRRRSSRSMPASLWWQRRGATGRLGLGQNSGLFASVAAAATGTGLFMAAKWLMASFGGFLVSRLDPENLQNLQEEKLVRFASINNQ
jgi:hypothetical protein